MDAGLLIVALIYAISFWTISWKHPPVALALIFAPAPFQNDLSAGIGAVHFSFSEINLVLTLPLFITMLVMGRRRARVWPLFWVSAAYTLACIASALVKWHGSNALSSFVQLFLFLFVIVPIFAKMGERPSDLKPALWGMIGVGVFFSLAELVYRSHYVFGIHKNGVGGSLACCLIVAVEMWFHYRDKPSRHKFLLIGAMGVISMGLLLTLSRGGWLAAMSGIMVVTALRRQFGLLLRAGLVMIPLIAVAWSLVPQESREYATGFGSDRGNIKARYINSDMALAAWKTNFWFGDGLGLRKELDATNLVVFTLGETGVVGLVTFAAMFVAFFAWLWRSRALLPREGFAFSLMAIGGGLMMSRLLQGMVDHYWARGPTMMAWAAAGMASGALWYAPEGARDRLQRARALLSVHLLESLRRTRNGDQSLPKLTQSELAAAQSALAVMKRNGQPRFATMPRQPQEDDALSELAEQLQSRRG